MGFCIGGPFIGGLLKRAPNRVAAAVISQPVGWRPEMRDRSYQGSFWKTWPALITAKRPEISMQTAEQFIVKMFETDADFLFTVSRDFMRTCQNPILVMPDDVPAHPLAPAMECAMLAPKAEITIFPWKEPKERIPTGGAPGALLPQGASARVRRHQGDPMRVRTSLARLAAVAAAAAGFALAVARPRARRKAPRVASGRPTVAIWGSTRYARARSDRREQLRHARVAWRFSVANLGPTREYTFESTPLVVDGGCIHDGRHAPRGDRRWTPLPASSSGSTA
jgi:hypothetical protein